MEPDRYIFILSLKKMYVKEVLLGLDTLHRLLGVFTLIVLCFVQTTIIQKVLLSQVGVICCNIDVEAGRFCVFWSPPEKSVT